jgi:hypothetical protein
MKSRTAKAPAFQPPLAAIAVKALPEGNEWLYELKLDGYRALIIKDGDRVQIRSRKDKDLTYPSVVAAARKLRAQQAVVDGEIVSRNGKRIPTRIETLCVHGDEPTAIVLAGACRRALEAAGVKILTLPEMKLG